MIGFKKTVMVAAVLAALGGAAQAAVVDFNSQAPGSLTPGSSFDVGGLRFTLANNGSSWEFVDLGNGNIALARTPSETEIPIVSPTSFTIQLVGGGTFGFVGFDHGVSENQVGDTLVGTGPVLFSGNGHATVNQSGTSFAVEFGFDTLPGYAYFDNIEYSTQSTPVPEPDSLALVGAGLAAFGLAAGRSKRRRKSKE